MSKPLWAYGTMNTPKLCEKTTDPTGLTRQPGIAMTAHRRDVGKKSVSYCRGSLADVRRRLSNSRMNMMVVSADNEYLCTISMDPKQGRPVPTKWLYMRRAHSVYLR
jgi:hypothetical protein